MGILWVAATPIGNLGDVSRRFVETLSRISFVACEDTRDLKRLCSALSLPCPNHISLFEHNEESRIDEIMGRLASGMEVLLVSSAGTPLVSDPGYRLVSAAISAGHKVSPIPGACAPIAAISCSGLRTDRFAFLGFPPRKPGKRLAMLRALTSFEGTIVMFESPFRVAKLARECHEVFGSRPAVLARELTKVHEEFIREPLGKLADLLAAKQVKGECVLLIEIRSKTEEVD
ncbi:MAG: 16S rRNA (cytidine(1402)-2'-O)-methyltransferase [Planctomycetota bacterium]